MSRSGNSGTTPGWKEKVEWQAADIFEPDSYKHLLGSCTAIVHSMGILMENDYKQYLNGSKGISDLVSSALSGGKNPLEQKTQDVMTYEKMNRDSARTLLDASLTPKIQAFVYVSAADVFPAFIDRRYISTKREAEAFITAKAQEEGSSLRPIFPRPGFMYSQQRPATLALAQLLGLSSKITSSSSPLPSLVKAGLANAPLVGQMLSTPPLNVDIVARAIVNAIDDPTVAGPLAIQDIEYLATR